MCTKISVWWCQFQKGELSNAELRILTEELGRIRYGDNEARIKHISIRGLLPDTEHYMTYEGSTTAPGCHETVTWIVLNKPIYITLQQVSRTIFSLCTSNLSIFVSHTNASKEHWIRQRYKRLDSIRQKRSKKKTLNFFCHKIDDVNWIFTFASEQKQNALRYYLFWYSSLFTRNRNAISIWLRTKYANAVCVCQALRKENHATCTQHKFFSLFDM